MPEPEARGLAMVMKTDYTKGNINVFAIIRGGDRGKEWKIRREERGKF